MTTLGFGSRNGRISISNLATIGCIFPQMSQVEFQGKLSFKSNWLKKECHIRSIHCLQILQNINK